MEDRVDMPVVPHIFHPIGRHTHTAIALHNHASDGLGYATRLFEGKLSSGMSLRGLFPSWKWIFPSSPIRYVVYPQERMRQWFLHTSLPYPNDQHSLQLHRQELTTSIKFIQGIIERESGAIGGSKQIVLLGFGQGCATALLTLLASQLELGACIGLSGWLPCPQVVATTQENGAGPGSRLASLATLFQDLYRVERITTPERDVENHHERRDELSVAAQAAHESTLQLSHQASSNHGEPESVTTGALFDTPIFVGHAYGDHYIPIYYGQLNEWAFVKLGFNVTYIEYEQGGHTAFLETRGLDDLATFITAEVMEKYRDRCPP